MKLMKSKIWVMSRENTIQLDMDVHGSDRGFDMEVERALKTLGVSGNYVVAKKKAVVGSTPLRSGTLTNVSWSEVPEGFGLN